MRAELLKIIKITIVFKKVKKSVKHLNDLAKWIEELLK